MSVLVGELEGSLTAPFVDRAALAIASPSSEGRGDAGGKTGAACADRSHMARTVLATTRYASHIPVRHVYGDAESATSVK